MQPSRKYSKKAAQIEAALYVAGRPLDLGTLGSTVRLRAGNKVRELALSVAQRYREASGSIEVMELQDGRFVMQLKPEFVREVRKLATKRLLTLGPLRTLSYIAARQPITQSHVVKVRGKLAYKHIRQLKDLQLISKSSIGRTSLLRTTQNFADYFNLSHGTRVMKRQLDRLFSQPSVEKGDSSKND